MLSPSASPGRKIFAKGTLLLLTVIFFNNSCKNKSRAWLDVDPGFSRYVEAYTTGIVSKTSSIRVQLAADAASMHTVGQTVTDKLFSLTPSVKGKATWLDARTIEFKPEKNMEADQLYEVNFKLGKVTTVPEKFKELRFNLQTVKPSFKVLNTGLRSDGSKDKMFLNGEVNTADIEEGKQIEKVLSASQNNKSLAIAWQHATAGKTHSYTINGIQRGNNAVPLTLTWNGKAMDINVSGNDGVSVPAAGDFKVLNVMPVNESQQYASVQFSDPIAVGQDLTGLVSISNETDVSYTINGSEVKLFSGKPLEGNYTVNVNAGIKNIWGVTLPGGFTSNVVFENRKPSVKILGKGNILPNSGKLVLPFDAINLSAVDISIIKIYENNVPQFLQQNNIGGEEELRRVAKPIVQRTLKLDDDKTLDLHVKQRFSLDIDKFLKTEPGAIYRVTIGFRPAYSLYSKDAADTASAAAAAEERSDNYADEENYNRNNASDDDDTFWSAYNDFYPNGYNWERKDDPLSRSYYNKDRWAIRNILASNIGLTAKR